MTDMLWNSPLARLEEAGIKSLLLYKGGFIKKALKKTLQLIT
eukprot:CAMPEP_0175108298 /NCGR_PEP_ID=MMETSP0086_2-20121207/12548_1 /TAXON_ID=136419 /ORGANISM="Unknown Unknown, Strain D1" /LENGTH=41 /DNA_ID= /DNA_START= /DNA_END= /DNA_ORIENTATION=